jgi:hypothetical protein
MPIPTFEIIVILCAVCGVIMVGGGIYLLYKGIIKLAAAPKEKALSIEFKKDFRVTTQYPALGIFIIGLAFLAIALFVSKPPVPAPIEFTGTVENIDSPLTIFVKPEKWSIGVGTDGIVNGVVTPNLNILWIEAKAPGYKPIKKSVRKQEIKNGIANLGVLSSEQVVAKVQPVASNIIDLPSGINIPPVSSEGTFGGTD